MSIQFCASTGCEFWSTEETKLWPEPLCKHHYAEAAKKPPRTILEYLDGHKEMRDSYVYGRIYKDVLIDYDDQGEPTNVRRAWFEQAWIHRTETGKPVMLCYVQIPDPTPVAVKNAIATSAAPSRVVSAWRRFARWLRLQWFMMGMG